MYFASSHTAGDSRSFEHSHTVTVSKLRKP